MKQGFTLIELIVVIVILGILAVTAAPKFINVRTEATIATMQGLVAAIESSMALTHGLALVKSKHDLASSTVDNGNQTISLVYGYPDSSATGLISTLEGSFSNSSGTAADWAYFASAGGVVFSPYSKVTDFDIDGLEDTDCIIVYNIATATSSAAVRLDTTDGC